MNAQLHSLAALAHLLTRRACLWAALAALFALVVGPPPAPAAVTEAWVHRYSNVVSNSYDYAIKVVRDTAGDIIVTGSTHDPITSVRDMLTIKYSGADGSVLWQKRYDSSANYNDYATAVALDGSGNVVVSGYSATVKYAAADGALLWEQRYNGWYPAAVAVDGSGNVIVTRSSYHTNNLDYYTTKYAAADGAHLWEQRYNGPANSDDYASAVAVDGSGNVLVAGTSGTIKYLADGTGVWTNNAGATALAVDGGGNVLVTGSSWNGTNNDYYTAKYAATNGVLLWEKRYNGLGNGDDQAHAVTVDGSGNVVVTGSSGYSVFGGNHDYYTAKYAAADGALLWERRYNGPANSDDFATVVAVDGSGDVVVTGSSYKTANFDYYTAKYAAVDGALLWEQRYNGPGNGDDQAVAVAVDGSGNVVVTGYSVFGGNPDYYTAKYAAADGAQLWGQRYNGPSNGYDSAHAVAVDGSGNVVVTGSSRDSGNSSYDYTAKYAAADGALLWEKRSYGGDQAVAVDCSGNVLVAGNSVTIKYLADGTGVWTNKAGAAALAVDGSGDVLIQGSGHYAKNAAADGALLWEKRYDGPAHESDFFPTVFMVDSNGNVVVTGYSYGSNLNYDFYTAKYAAADGALLWEQRYHSPGNWDWDIRATAVAVDASGNVVVTRSSYNTNSNAVNSDYYTAKYAAADGALLWEKRYNGPLNSDDYARAVAVDGSGNVVVTGVSDVFFSDGDGDYPRGDYYTAKYAAADGALLWEKRYNGTGGRDVALAVAVDGSGNVLVTGYSEGVLASNSVDPVYDYYTAKYAAANGALLWEKRYNGSATTYVDVRLASRHRLALGPNGMVAITGTLDGDGVTVVYRDDVDPISIAWIPAGVHLRFTGIPDRSYTIERAPAVTGPWTTLATPTAPASGLIEYLDAPPPPGQAFYRTAQP